MTAPDWLAHMCAICGPADATGLCDPCWHEAQHDAAERQDAALAAGRRAEAEGRPVIYVHGRPYADPGDIAGEAHDAEAPHESPWPWDLWNDLDGRQEAGQ